MSDIPDRIRRIGDLHDCQIVSIEVVPDDKLVRIMLDDVLTIVRNPKSPDDRVPGVLEFTGVSQLMMAGEPNPWIYQVEVDVLPRGFSTSILLNDGNRINIASDGMSFQHGPLGDVKRLWEEGWGMAETAGLQG